MNHSDRMMLLVGIFLLTGLIVTLNGVANPFVTSGLGAALSTFLSWQAGKKYRLFTGALLVLTFAVSLAAIPALRNGNIQVVPIFCSYILLLLALWRLPNPQRPGIWAWTIWGAVLSATCLLLFVRYHLHQMPWKSFSYAFAHFLLVFSMLPALQAILESKAPYGRSFVVLGVLVCWLAALFHGIDAKGWSMPDPKFPEVMWFIGNTLFGLGVYTESQHFDVGMWPFVLGVGSLEAAWITGVLGLKGMASPFFIPWLVIGAVMLFICAWLLLLGYQGALQAIQERLHTWLGLLDDLSHVAEDGHSTVESLQNLFYTLQKAAPGLVGAALQIGGQTYPIGTKGPFTLTLQEDSDHEPIGCFYAHDPKVFQELRSVTHLLSARLREIALKLDYKSQSLVDPLTGLWNRRGLSQRLTNLVRDARRKQYPCAVLVIDLDHFKQINDTHGHETGDAVLKVTAQTLLNVFRDEDICVRWGGEEFLVILAHASLEEAKAAAGRFLQALSALDLNLGWPVTASIGVAGGGIPNTQEDFVYWRNKADQTCYLAKQQGRNQVVCSGEKPNGSLDVAF